MPIAAGKVQPLGRARHQAVRGHAVGMLIRLPGIVDDQLIRPHAGGQLRASYEGAVVIVNANEVIVLDGLFARGSIIDERERLAAMQLHHFERSMPIGVDAPSDMTAGYPARLVAANIGPPRL